MKTFYFSLILLTFLTCAQKSNDINDVVAEATPNSFNEKLAMAAISIVDPNIVYTPSYISIKYPNGDVPVKTGVCSDVVIRAYRKLGIDLQKEVHEDMKANFSKYPTKWGLKKTDTNIESIGRGYEKPITTNKTASGRAQNRRVDLIITPQSAEL